MTRQAYNSPSRLASPRWCPASSPSPPRAASLSVVPARPSAPARSRPRCRDAHCPFPIPSRARAVPRPGRSVGYPTRCGSSPAASRRARSTRHAAPRTDRVSAPHSSDFLVADFARRILPVRPGPRRRQQRLCLSRHLAPAPVRQRHVSLPPQAAQPRDAMRDRVRQPLVGQQRFQCLANIVWHGLRGGRYRGHLRPEFGRVARVVERNRARPVVVLREHERFAALLQAPGVAREDGVTRLIERDCQATSLARQVGADGEADQVAGVGEGACLVEIVDPPNQAACASRQVPKFSTWRSPTARSAGALASSGQTSESVAPSDRRWRAGRGTRSSHRPSHDVYARDRRG